MSASATSGVGAGAISAMQSAGALFMNAVGGSTVAAVASVAVPVVAAVGGYYAYNNYISMSHNTTENNQQNLMSQIMASGTPKPDGSQAQNPTVPNGSEPTMVPK